MPIASINPANGETIRTFEALTNSEIEQKLQLSIDAFRNHRRSSFKDRAVMMNRAAEILESEKEEFGRT